MSDVSNPYLYVRRERLEALEEIRQAVAAFSLHDDGERTYLTYEHADGEACVVAELKCPAVLEVASLLWPEDPG